MHLSKFIESQTGKIVMSILLGVGLATLFRKACTGKNCVVNYAPPLDEIDDKIYKFNDKCYKLQKSAVKCNHKKQIVNFE